MERIPRLALGAAMAVLVAASCSADDSGERAGVPATGVTAAAPAGQRATTVPLPTPATVDSAATTSPATTGTVAPEDVALTYVGAANAAAATATAGSAPIVIGYVNEEGGTPSFPEATLGASAAVDHVNAVLGGVQGHPVELRTCFVVAAGDGERCASQMTADDDVDVVLVGTISRERLVGPLLAGLRGNKPVVIANPLTTREFVADDAYAFTPGAPGVIQGMSVFAARHLPGVELPRLALVVHADSAAGRAAFTALAKPALDALAVPSVAVAVPDGAAPAQVVSAITAAGGTSAEVVVALTPMSGCIALVDALARIGREIPVVATELCRGDEMARHLVATGSSAPGEAPDGWYFGGTGYSYAIPGNPEIDAYLSTIADYASQRGMPDLDPAGFAGPTFGHLLTIVRLMNDVGVTALTPEGMRQAIRSFPGPMWGVVGPMACGSNTAFPALCGGQVGIQRYVGGRWVSVRDGANGRPIDPRQELAG